MIPSRWENKDMGQSNIVEIENKSDVNLHGLEPGKRISIKVDRNGLPLDRHWRRRLKDSEIDGCVAIIEEKKAEKKEKKEKKSKSNEG